MNPLYVGQEIIDKYAVEGKKLIWKRNPVANIVSEKKPVYIDNDVFVLCWRN